MKKYLRIRWIKAGKVEAETAVQVGEDGFDLGFGPGVSDFTFTTARPHVVDAVKLELVNYASEQAREEP